MTRINLVTIVITVIFGAKCLSAQTSVAVQNSIDVGSEQLENFQVDTGSIGIFFSDLSLIYDIPIGLEIAANRDESARYAIDFKKGTVEQLLKQFVGEHPQYTWNIEDGVVNVFPKDSYRDRMFGEVLATRIGKLSIRRNTSCWNFLQSLFARAELKTILEANKTTYSGRDPSGFYIPQLGRRFTLWTFQISR